MRVFVLLALVLSAAAVSPVAAVEPPGSGRSPLDMMRRVRAHDPRIREAIENGQARSAAFRDVLRRVEANDVIVYIELDPGMRGSLAGQMRWVVKTKDARYVRVSLNPELSGSHLISTLAHELQHVVEVGDAPSVVDEPTLSTFYSGIGTERGLKSRAWDTEAAQLTGDVVRRELASSGVAPPGQL